MHRISFGFCLLVSLFLGGCYAAAWDRDKLDYWSQQELAEPLYEALPDFAGRDEVRVLVFGDSGKPETFKNAHDLFLKRFNRIFVAS